MDDKHVDEGKGRLKEAAGSLTDDDSLKREGKVDQAKIEKALAGVMDLSPRGIREHLKLNRPIYARTSAYGHFGRTPDADGGFSWEKTDLADALRSAVR